MSNPASPAAIECYSIFVSDSVTNFLAPHDGSLDKALDALFEDCPFDPNDGVSPDGFWSNEEEVRLLIKEYVDYELWLNS